MAYRRCTLRGCGFKHYARGFCRGHYRRWRLYGDASFSKRAPTKVRNHKEDR